MESALCQNLISESLRGDKVAFGKLVEMFQSQVFGLSVRFLGDVNLARDVSQDVFLKAWEKLATYNPDYPFRTWLFTITSRRCLDILKSSQRYRMTNNESLKEISDGSCIEKEFSEKEFVAIVKEMSGRLTPKQQLVFTLYDLEGLEAKDVEKITGLSKGKIKSNLYLARQTIRQLLDNLKF